VANYSVATLDTIPARDRWIPVRDHFGIGAFGVNAYRADEAGDSVISNHTETMGKHEELFVVVRGHATFTVDGDEIDAPAGTLVAVSDPASRRGAVAKEAGTIVLVTGARPGHAFEIGQWERHWEENTAAMKLYREQRYAEAADLLRGAVAHHPDAAGLRYNLACFDSLAGAAPATVVEELGRAIELHPSFRDMAQEDDDFAPVRDVPEFRTLVGEAR
jgi:hypothetical protein